MTYVLGDDSQIVTSKRLVFRQTSSATGSHSAYADALETFLASYISTDYIQRSPAGGRYRGKFPPESKAALVEDMGIRQERYTNRSNMQSHLFRIYFYFGDLRQSERFDTIADLTEEIQEALDKEEDAFSAIAGHTDTHAEIAESDEDRESGFRNVDGLIEVILTEEV